MPFSLRFLFDSSFGISIGVLLLFYLNENIYIYIYGRQDFKIIDWNILDFSSSFFLYIYTYVPKKVIFASRTTGSSLVKSSSSPEIDENVVVVVVYN